MMQRCYNPNVPGWKHWGGRGIKPCEFLKASPVNLLLLLGNKPKKSALDRIDNDLGYFCGVCEDCMLNRRKLNVRWASSVQSRRNTQKSRFLTIKGETLPLGEWAERFGVTRCTIYNKLKLSLRKQKILEISEEELRASKLIA